MLMFFLKSFRLYYYKFRQEEIKDSNKREKKLLHTYTKTKKHTFCKKEKNQPLKKRRLFSWQLASHHDLNDVLKFKTSKG